MSPDTNEVSDLERRLNAYVDSELSVAEAAEFAALLTRDRALAGRIATLTRLKAELGASLEPAPDIGQRNHTSTRARAWHVAIAATLLLAAAVGLFSLSVLQDDAPGPAASSAWDWHDRWVAQSDRDGGTATSLADDFEPSGATGSFLHTQFPQASQDLYMPDLSAARLMLAHTEFGTDRDGRPLVHAGYVGSRGCRLSLFIYVEAPGPDRTAEGGPAMPAQIADALAIARGPAEALAWQNAGLSYLLLARGMDPGHFATVSRTVRRLTIEQQPPDDAAVMALAESRARALPCQA